MKAAKKSKKRILQGETPIKPADPAPIFKIEKKAPAAVNKGVLPGPKYGKLAGENPSNKEVPKKGAPATNARLKSFPPSRPSATEEYISSDSFNMPGQRIRNLQSTKFVDSTYTFSHALKPEQAPFTGIFAVACCLILAATMASTVAILKSLFFDNNHNSVNNSDSTDDFRR